MYCIPKILYTLLTIKVLAQKLVYTTFAINYPLFKKTYIYNIYITPVTNK